MEEAGVDQVHGGMLDPAGVDIHGHPIVVLLRIEGGFVVVGAEVAQVIPGGAHEGVHGIGLALGLPAAFRAGGVAPGWVQLQGAFAGGQPLDIFGQQHGQLVIRHGHRAALFAVDDRDRRAPIALAGDQPVPQAVVHRALADAAFFQIGNRFIESLLAGRAGQRAGVDHVALGRDRFGHLVRHDRVQIFGLDDHDDRQVIFAGEFKVALVVRGHGHDRAGAIAHQDVVGDPDRDSLAVDGVDGIAAGEDAGLFAVGGLALDIAHQCGFLLIGFDRGFLPGCGQLCDQLVFRRQHHEGGAPERVGPGGEDLDLVAAFGGEDHGGAF